MSLCLILSKLVTYKEFRRVGWTFKKKKKICTCVQTNRNDKKRTINGLF